MNYSRSVSAYHYGHGRTATDQHGNVRKFIVIIIYEFHRDTSLEQNFRAAECHVLHYSCNVSGR